MSDDEGCEDPRSASREVTPTHQPDPFPLALQAVKGAACDLMAHPSAHVYVTREYDDYLMVAPVDAVWYEWEGKTYEAMCLDVNREGACTSWIAGWEQAGDIKVFTEYCEDVYSVNVHVERSEDGCHVETEFVMLDVGTRGCLTTPTVDQPEPPPTRVDDMRHG